MGGREALEGRDIYIYIYNYGCFPSLYGKKTTQNSKTIFLQLKKKQDTSWKPLHSIMLIRHSPCFQPSLHSSMWTFCCLLNPFSADSHLCCFQSPTVSNRAASNSLVHMEVSSVAAFLVLFGFSFCCRVFRIHL